MPNFTLSAEPIRLIAVVAILQSSPPTTLPTTAPATNPAAGRKAFQPGIQIDWERSEVVIQAQVAVRQGALELLACWPGKEHESVFVLRAAARDVFLALGLIGLEPGAPPTWDESMGRYARPTGSLVDIFVEHRGQRWPASSALRIRQLGQPPLQRPWVYSGSRTTPSGDLSAARSGNAIAIVDFPDSLISPIAAHSDQRAELWAEANPDQIPAEDEAVSIVIRPAAVANWHMRLNERGHLYAGLGDPPPGTSAQPQPTDQFLTESDAAELIDANRRLDAMYVQQIDARGALRSDIRRLRQRLLRAGIPADAFRLIEN